MKSQTLPETGHAITEWPHLVGKLSGEVEAEVKRQRPDVRVHILRHGSMVTTDYNVNRVRIYVDNGGKVVAPPVVG
jgi:hypothetical protein